jgi:hypothetical protein
MGTNDGARVQASEADPPHPSPAPDPELDFGDLLYNEEELDAPGIQMVGTCVLIVIILVALLLYVGVKSLAV